MPRLALFVCFAALLCAAPASAAPGSAPVPFPVVERPDDALIDGGTAYVAGDMQRVGRPSGPLSFLDASGAVRHDFPDITSDGAGAGLDFEDEIPGLSIRALEPDGEGGFYVGGEFDRVLGQRRVNFVHLRADGTIDPVFRAQASGLVMEIERRGDVLYVGGTFSVIGGKVKRGLAKLDARTGEVLDWGPAGGIGQVESLSISGDRMFVAGSFTSPRRGAAALDLATGRVLDWDAHLEDSVQLRAIAARDGRVFFGGHFSWVQNKELSGAAAVSADDSATLSPWRPGGDEVTQLELGPQAVVMIGDWDEDGTTLRAYDQATGARLPWFGDIAGKAYAITTDGDTLYVATGGTIVSYDLRTGARLPYLSTAGSGTLLAAGGGALATNGGTMRDTTARVGAAALDLRSGAVLPFDAQLEGTVREPVPGSFPAYYGTWADSLEKAGDTVYIGGAFATVGGHPQTYLTAVDAVTGAWRPGFPSARGGPVTSLAISGSTLFAAGHFTQLGERTVTKLGAIDLATGQVLDWAPSFPRDCHINALEVVGSKLFVGACELRIYDVATRAALPATGQPEGTVYALEPDGVGGVWVGGRAYWDQDADLRHIDANGLNVPYDVTDGAVHEIEAAGSELFLAGAFSELAGEPRWSLGSIDLSTGRTTRFRPEPATDWGMGHTLSMLETLPDGGLLIGGNFRFTSLRAVSGLARFAPSGETSPPTARGEAPIIVGEAATGSVQRVYGGDFAGSPVTIDAHWQRCSGSTCTDIDHVGWSYTLEDEDAGHRLRVALVAQNDAGASEPLLSEPGPVALGPKPFAIYPAYPYMYGEPRVGATLTMADGLWEPAPTAQRYTWQRCDYEVGCRPIPGATGRTYTTTSADAGQRLRATVYAINAAGERAFTAHEEIGPILTGAPSGPNWGKTPTPVFIDSVGGFTHGDRHIGSENSNGRIGWLRCDASGANCTRLASELQAYQATPADLGHTLRQTLVTFGPGGESPEITSERSPVIGPGPVPTPTPTPNPDPSPTPVPTPPANSWPTGTATPVPTTTATPTATVPPGPTPSPTATVSPGPTTSPAPTASPDPTASPSPDPTVTPPAGDATPDPTATAFSPGFTSPAATVRPPAPSRTTAPAPRVTATLLRDGRVRLRADAKGTVIVRVRDKQTKRVIARRTVKVVKGTKTVRVGKARRGVYVEVAWR